MDWIQSMQKAINYIEDNLLEDIDSDRIAKSIYTSNAHFQRIFSIITGMTISDYIRYRRLSLAGQELTLTKAKVIDIAFKYGYDTPDSFAKAFIRFHGITPSSARKLKHSLKCFDPLSIQISIRGGFHMSRKLISNVPLITMHSDGYSYLTSFVGALYGALISVGENYDYAELLSCSGLGNRLCWTEGQWIFGNENIENCNVYPFEIQDRLLNAIGWKVKRIVVERDDSKHAVNISEGKIRQDFVDSINKGIPVLAQGITDDGCKHDYDVFYGYEGDGEKIIGWDYYQNNDQPFIRENWERELISYMLLTEKAEPVSERKRIIAAFKAITGHARQGVIRGRKVGFAAWESFLNQLEHDDFSKCSLHPSEEMPNDENGVNSLEHRFIIYCDALCQISQRGQILPYYKRLVEKFPEWAQELNIAITAWQDCAGYGGYLWSQGFSFDDKGYEKFRSPEMRRILADEGRRAMKKEIEAIEQIEKILQKEKCND
ncbi:MAG: helix-turn-helix transcriptional regulator [Firmicutes bacterium]|nr:helix-turn-helix transcriptional regulator [Bacillota bacterium]